MKVAATIASAYLSSRLSFIVDARLSHRTLTINRTIARHVMLSTVAFTLLATIFSRIVLTRDDAADIVRVVAAVAIQSGRHTVGAQLPLDDEGLDDERTTNGG